jgi:hypothetical protein
MAMLVLELAFATSPGFSGYNNFLTARAKILGYTLVCTAM